MVVNCKLPLESLLYCAAPMVGQSDLPFRLQTVHNGATSTWTQMYLAPDLNSDRDMLETLCKSLELGKHAPENVVRDGRKVLEGEAAPQIVQLAGNDVQQLVDASRKVAPFADAIDLNLGCPQRHAEQGHYGAYLLPKQNWTLLAEIVSSLAHAVDVPITTKIRLTVPKEQTPQLAVTLARAGSSLVTLHPRFASSVRRRKGLADLDQVVHVREALQAEGLLRNSDQPRGDTAVVSNGNVRCWSDIVDNLELTGVSGVMVGETLLENPALFHPSLPKADRVGPSAKEMALEYLDLRDRFHRFESQVKVAKQHLQSILGSISYTASVDPNTTAERHRYAASMTQIIKSIQSDSDLVQFRHQHLQ
ncbi:related to tRNA dihydrouridine synthase [Sporisorium scitamineum]|uniref:tRNA-dihydrouridine(16/17) synthase [NAD(P)(+)] n=1 Tax=Sporisorium scitamineum TaxID=49012 RepID=A0A0F7RZ71_9BASI|nr:hypothetical protein [Sporisorium scitamineum]CDU23744.1 related to tRNA dihydrouridine synthase [Sporisorium scitamineum]